VKLQDTAGSNTKLLFSIVDLHAITIPQDAKILKKWKRETLAILLAVGLNPERSILFYQSSVCFFCSIIMPKSRANSGV
jgi:tryptophanyl-tRNA synthetase